VRPLAAKGLSTRILRVALGNEQQMTVDTQAKRGAKEAEKDAAGKAFHDPRTAVTSLRWNPNKTAKHWIAAGTAIGVVALLRFGE
jgi:hypothetical protein